MARPWRVILLPGGVLPAGPAYGALLAALGSDVDARAKDLELHAAAVPPPGFSLATEVAGINRVADAAGFDRFPDFRIEVYPDRHHFDPPHRIEPARVAASLRAHWDRAEA